MFGKSWQHVKHQLQLMFRHRLDDKLAIVAEEEEATTPPCTFTRLEDLISIRIWAQTVLKHFLVTEEVLECFHEELASMEGDLNITTVSHGGANA